VPAPLARRGVAPRSEISGTHNSPREALAAPDALGDAEVEEHAEGVKKSGVPVAELFGEGEPLVLGVELLD
jgi:hypothetical protein